MYLLKVWKKLEFQNISPLNNQTIAFPAIALHTLGGTSSQHHHFMPPSSVIMSCVQIYTNIWLVKCRILQKTQVSWQLQRFESHFEDCEGLSNIVSININSILKCWPLSGETLKNIAKYTAYILVLHEWFE